MTDDPRALDRERARALTKWLQPIHEDHTRALRNIKAGIAPCDDELPMAQAVRHREEMEQASKSWRKRRKT